MKRLMYCCMPFNSVLINGNDSSDGEAPPIGHSTRKKLYKPPKVIEYGNVTRLTAGMNGSNIDPGHDTRTRLGGSS